MIRAAIATVLTWEILRQKWFTIFVAFPVGVLW